MPHALVIGGRRGIGAAVVAALAEGGFDVTFTVRGDAEAQLADLKTRHPNRSFATRSLDLSNRAEIETLAGELEDGAALDALVQVGGTTYDRLAAMMEQGAAEALMQVNFWSFARLARAAIRPMTRARAGRIIAIGSVVGQQASQGNAAYGASKSALLAFVKTLAIETARRGVTVNYIAPGFVDTDMMAPFAAHRAATESRVPAGRYARPDEIAAVAAFLASPAASYITGAMIPVDGGLTASLGVPRG
jgi:NAD(P)-dependent dehydrogenase (short-subunit alcohol dehydrogenase family)